MVNTSEKFNYVGEKLKKILSREELEAVNEDADQLIDLGFESVELGEYEKAYDLFTINMTMNGSSPDAVNGLAISLCEMGQTDKALEVLQYAAKLYPDDSITLTNLAGIYLEKMDHDNAIYYYTRSLEFNSQIMDTYFNLANAYYERGDFFMAYLTSLNLVREFPDDEQALKFRDDLLLDIAISTY
jgi:Flp pilus assembly protein TadD